jgi:hypothetical protein
MTIEIDSHQSNDRVTLLLPDKRLVRRFPSIASIAALDAAMAMTKIAILCDHPSIQELIDMIEDGQKVPSHLFIAHNIIDNLDRLRLTVQTYFLHLDSQLAKIADPDFPF